MRIRLQNPLLSFALILLFISGSGLAKVSAQDVATWYRYPSISPDGKEIMFSSGGDLYKVASTGGQAIQLTQHVAHDFMPVWSNDGKSIAFASNRYGNFDIFIMPANGGKARRLTFNSAGDYPGSFNQDNSGVLFSSIRLDEADNAAFPHRSLPELYEAPTMGGRVKQVLTTPAIGAVYSPNGTKILYHDRKGVENIWRKHHTSSITRDIWMYEPGSGKHTQLTTFSGEDRNPVWSGDKEMYYLSEQSGSFNVWKAALDDPSGTKQVTIFTKHPVRFLSISGNGTLCFGFDGGIYTLAEGQNPVKLNITISTDEKYNDQQIESVSSGVKDVALSPNGKEVAFVVRGDVFVTALEHKTTKRITNTPEQERSVSFSPNGRKIIYASERNQSWNIYESSIKREEEAYFYLSTLVEEKTILEDEFETFQPAYSPDGKEVAYLHERTTVKVINLASKAIRDILSAEKNYSYSDGDQWFEWSPDGKWFLVQYMGYNRWMDDVGLVASDGKSEVINLTKSGYGDWHPKWMRDGKMMLWFSDRHGMRSHGSWGSQGDAYAMFFARDEFDRFKLKKEEYELIKDEEGEDKEEENDEDKKNKKSSERKKKKKKIEVKLADPIKIELEGIEDRKVRLTLHSSSLADAVISPDGEKLYYLSKFEKGHDLWVHKFYERETKLLAKLEDSGGHLIMDKEGKKLVVLSHGKIHSIDTKDGKKTSVNFSSEQVLDKKAERAHMFEHVWRQVKKKFYVKDLHGVDWDYYKKEYAKFLPAINNNYDFAEMLSELLGELNASHTGSGHRPKHENQDATASLGLFYELDFTGKGLKIKEVIDKSPVLKADSKIKAGVVIEKIDGVEINANDNYYPLLNRKADQLTLLSLYDPRTKERWDEAVRPIDKRKEYDLLYQRWVKQRREATEKLSNGRIGYVHIRGMNDASFRVAYSEILGRNNDKEAIVVDTRFNGGGWLHDDLATLLGGKEYIKFSPRGQENMGSEPIFKWSKPSIVVMSESNYSDAHMFPFTYRALDLGKLVGMPVPGTGTAVWWEWLIDPTVYFGIPQVGMKAKDGKYLENNQLEPDIKVTNAPAEVAKGKDAQLEAAVEELLKGLK